MEPVQIIFLLTAAVVLIAALMVVTTKNLIHAALWLVLTLFGVAVAFVLLEAPFLAMAQVVIYIGAISILLIFAVMLTRRIMQDVGPQTHDYWWLSAALAALLFGGLTAVLLNWGGATVQAPPLAEDADHISELGQALVNPNAFVIPFEVASILLLAALIGAIYVAWER